MYTYRAQVMKIGIESVFLEIDLGFGQWHFQWVQLNNPPQNIQIKDWLWIETTFHQGRLSGPAFRGNVLKYERNTETQPTSTALA